MTFCERHRVTKRNLQKRLAAVEKLLSGAVDCVLEGRNNVERSEFDFAERNFQILFRNASKIARQRKLRMRELRQVKREGVQ